MPAAVRGSVQSRLQHYTNRRRFTTSAISVCWKIRCVPLPVTSIGRASAIRLVEATIRALDPVVSFRSVHASRGKGVRAEPIAALYEQKKVHHVSNLGVLEDQMCSFTSDFDRSRVGYSPGRGDDTRAGSGGELQVSACQPR